MSCCARWTIVGKDPREHVTILRVVRRRGQTWETGFFKYVRRGHQARIGPLLANEMIATRLARMIGLPVSRIEKTTFARHEGILSFVRDGGPVWTWSRVQRCLHTPNLLPYIWYPSRLYQTIVFDVWICNLDRSGSNIILYRRGSRFDFYLIDHELALLGALHYEEKPWNAPFWNDVRRYTDGYQPALLPYIKRYSDLAPFVRRIQRIPSREICAVVRSVSPPLLSKHEQHQMETLLLQRQRCLHRLVSTTIK